MVSLPHLFGLADEDVFFLPARDIVGQMDLRFVTQQENVEQFMLKKPTAGDLTVTDWSVINVGGTVQFFLTTALNSSGNAFLGIDAPGPASREYRRWWRNPFKHGN